MKERKSESSRQTKREEILPQRGKPKILKERVGKVMLSDSVTPLRCSIIKQLRRLLSSNCDVNQGKHPSFIASGIRGGDGT